MQPQKGGRTWNLDPNYGIEQFLYCLVLHMVAPVAALVPIFIARRALDSLDVALTASVYMISIAIHSKDRILRFLYLCGVVIFAFWTGYDSSGRNDDFLLAVVSWTVIAFVFLAHCIERWDRHVLDKEGFFHS